MENKKEMEKKLGCNKEEVTRELRENEVKEDTFMLTEIENKLGFFSSFLVKWKEKGKSIIVLMIKWILLTFLAGLLEHWCEPIYKELTPSFILQEESSDTENKIQISVNTKIYVWVDVKIYKEIVTTECCGRKVEKRTYNY